MNETERSLYLAIERGWLDDLFKRIKEFFSPTVKERWVLGTGGKSETNCPKCREFADMGEKPFGYFPMQRAETTYCGPDCTCTFEYSDGKKHEISRVAKWDVWEKSFMTTNRSQNDLSDDDAAFILASYSANPDRTFFIHRNQDNRYRWFAWPACTAFINRDREIDSMALFDNFIAHIERTQEWPYLTFFHQGERFRLGDADFVARDGVAYLVSGLFDESKIATEIIQGIERSDAGYWGTSINYKPIGQPYFIKEQGKNIPVYYDGIHKEVSLLPEFAASSIFTAFPIIKE